MSTSTSPARRSTVPAAIRCPSPEAFAHAMARAGIGDDDARGRRTTTPVDPSRRGCGGCCTSPAIALRCSTCRRSRRGRRSAGRWQPAGLAFAGARHVHCASLAAGSDRRRRRGPGVADARRGVVVDASAGERYRGEVEPIDPVAGHIPGAVSAAWVGNRDPRTDTVPVAGGAAVAVRRTRRARRGSTIASCGSGVTACLAVLAMERAGLPGARLYEGSWSDWIPTIRRARRDRRRTRNRCRPLRSTSDGEALVRLLDERLRDRR